MADSGVQLLFFFGPPVLLGAVVFVLARPGVERTAFRRLVVATLALTPVAALAFLPGIGGRSFDPLGLFICLGLPVLACVTLALTRSAREQRWLLVLATPFIWVLGLFLGLIVAVNLGWAEP